MNTRHGIGPASLYKVLNVTATEAVGAATGAGLAWNSKASHMQNSAAGNVVNLSRFIGNSTSGVPAQNVSACAHRDRRITAAASTGNAVVYPDHDSGPEYFRLSEVITFTLQDLPRSPDSELNATAMASKKHIDPVVAKNLQYFESYVHRRMRFNEPGTPCAILWLLGLVDKGYVCTIYQSCIPQRTTPNPNQLRHFGNLL